MVLALLLIPSLAAAGFGTVWARDRYEAVTRAEIVAEETAIFAALSRLQFGLELKQIQASFVDSAPVSDAVDEVRSEPTNVKGPDQATLMASCEELLARGDALDRLTGGTGTPLVKDLLAGDLLLTTTETTEELADSMPEALDRLDRARRTARANASGESSGISEALTAFTDLQSAMTAEAAIIIELMSDPFSDEGDALELFVGEGRQQAMLDRVLASVPQPVASRLRNELALDEMTAVRRSMARTLGLTQTGPTFFELLTPDLYPQIQARYYVLPAAWSDLADAASEQATRAQHEAQNAFARAIAATIVMSMVTITAGAIVANRVSRRLSLLANRAGEIGHGEIEAAALPTSGPRELREATDAFNSMSGVLETLHRQIEAISTSRLDDASLTTELPGRIGADIQQSVRLLAETNTQLRSAQQLADAIIDAATDAIITLDERGERVRSANRASALLTGVPVDQMIGRRIDEMLIGLPDIVHTESTTSDVPRTLLRADGTEASVLVTARVIDGDGGERLRSLFLRDISGRELWEARFRYQTTHDELTGLPNRIALQDHLDRSDGWIDESLPVTVVSINLNRFRLVNDIMGHASGDQVLVRVGECLVSVAGLDGFSGRVGGNEFVIVTQAAADSTRSAVQLAADMLATCGVKNAADRATLDVHRDHHCIHRQLPSCSVGRRRRRSIWFDLPTSPSSTRRPTIIDGSGALRRAA